MAVDVIARAIGAANGSDSRKDYEELSIELLLHLEEINDTIQTITYNSDGSIQKIEHTQGQLVIRSDVFTFSDTTIVEVRTLNTGESLTITTNLETLTTTVVYSE